MSSIIFLYIIGAIFSVQVEGCSPRTTERIMQENSKSNLSDLYNYTSDLIRDFNDKLIEMKIANNIYIYGIIYETAEYLQEIVAKAEHTNHSVENCRQSQKVFVDACMAIVDKMNKCLTKQVATINYTPNNTWDIFNRKLMALLDINDVMKFFCDTKMGINMVECNDNKSNTTPAGDYDQCSLEKKIQQHLKGKLKTSVNAAISNASNCVQASRKTFDDIVKAVKLNAVKCIVDFEEK